MGLVSTMVQAVEGLFQEFEALYCRILREESALT